MIAALLFAGLSTAFAKTPTAPLAKQQYWIHSENQKLTIHHPTTSARTVEFQTCVGHDMNLQKAWDLTTGSRKVVVAVMDHGFKSDHESIRENIWTNPGETGRDANGLDKKSNQIDDDTNGYVDDVHGYSFRNENGDTNSYFWSIDNNKRGQLEANWHGQSALGIIGADGSRNFGVAGINWNISMMLLKTSDMNGAGFVDSDAAPNIARAIRYAVDNGAKVINWSSFLDQRHHDLTEIGKKKVIEAIGYAEKKGVLLVIAAGNGSHDIDKIVVDEPFPQRDLDFPNVIYVAEASPCGGLNEHSNFGPTRVKFAAPAENALTISVTPSGYDSYDVAGGTSTAAPMATGIAALILSVRPDFTYRELIDVMCKTSKADKDLENRVGCRGLLDAGAAVSEAINSKTRKAN